MSRDPILLNNPAIVRYMDKHYMAKENSAWSRKAIKIVGMEFCTYDKVRKTLTLSSEGIGMPMELIIRGHHTGKEVRFKAVDEGDPLFNEDGWDGEMAVYRPVGHVPNVDHLIISNPG